MILTDHKAYTVFCGHGTVLLLDTGKAIHAVRIDPPEQIGTAGALLQARDLKAFEVISNATVWPLNSTRVTCPGCDGVGCEGCHRRGWEPMETRPALQILAGEAGLLTATMLYLTESRQVSEVAVNQHASGPMIEAARKLVGTERHRNLRLADLLVLWQSAGMGEVLR